MLALQISGLTFLTLIQSKCWKPKGLNINRLRDYLSYYILSINNINTYKERQLVLINLFCFQFCCQYMNVL